MDSVDDDFGELYVDAKDQPETAASAGDEGSVDSSGKTVKPHPLGIVVVANDSSQCADACALNRTEESDYSDSDDDLDIVLKDDDSKALPAESGGYPLAYNACFDRSLEMLQCGYSYSHPCSRTSFDGNLDAFENKPWRTPGVDVSDFFNFGLNEQSWRDYCKPLKGRAIEVESGSGSLERKPSADLRRPRDSDPDVVIQVSVTDDAEELPTLTTVEAKSPSNEASRSEDSRSYNGNGLRPFDDSLKDEAFVGCLDENAGSFSGEQSTPTENCCSREVAVSEKEMIEEKKEETSWNSDGADTSSTKSESSRGDRIRISPISSYSVGRDEESEDYETESFKDGVTDDQREVSNPPRQARPREHEEVRSKSRERSDRTRHRRSHEDSSEMHCGRSGYAVHKHRVIKDESHTPDADFCKKVRSRHGSSYRDSVRNWQNGPPFTSERDETEGRRFLHSNREKYHDRHRDHKFGWRKNKGSSQGQGYDHSNVYRNETRPREYTSRSSLNVNQRNYQSSFKEEDDRYGRNIFEEKYGHERSSALAWDWERNKERNRFEWLRESYYEDSILLNDVDNRYQLEYSSAHGNPRQSHENVPHSRSSDVEYNFHRRRYEDRVHRAETGVPVELARREIHSFAAVGRREFRGYERNEEFLEINNRHDYSPDWHLDRFVSDEDDHRYRIEDAWPEPYRDHYYTKRPRGESWRDDTRIFTTEEYGSQINHLYKAAPRDGWAQHHVHSDHVSIQDRLMYEDDWVHRDRGRYPLVDDIQFSMRNVTHSEHDEMLTRDIRIPIHNRLSTKQRSGYFKSHLHETDERHHRSKKLRGNIQNTFIECQDQVDLTCRQGKLSNQSKKRFFNGGDTIEQPDGKKPKMSICRSIQNAVQVGDLNDKEEGEIVEETRNVKVDNERIQESLKKMVKRRERFKEVEATFKSKTEPRARTDDGATNLQRPIRKRRWCGGA